MHCVSTQSLKPGVPGGGAELPYKKRPGCPSEILKENFKEVLRTCFVGMAKGTH